MNKQVILVGGFNEIIELCEECGIHVVGIIDNQLKHSLRGIPIIGCDDDIDYLSNTYKIYPIVITPDSPLIRKVLFDLYSSRGFQFYTLISPSAHISMSAKIGLGTIIQTGVNISSDTIIGNFCKINTMSNIMHDNIISDFVTIAPNALLLGKVKVGIASYIGAHSTILPGIDVGYKSIVGAGAVVTKNIVANTTVVGVPAKKH